jgi:hypothetical protein
MKNKVKSLLFKAPFVLLIVFSLFGAMYDAINSIQGIRFSTPFILLILLVLYGYGEYLIYKKEEYNENIK